MSEFPLLSDERIDAIANEMPSGLDGFLKGWGWRQFAEAVESESRAPLLAEIERQNLSLLNHQEAWVALSDFCESQAAEIERLSAEVERLKADAERVRYSLGDGEGKLTTSQLARRGYGLASKAKKWDEWCEANARIETDMPAGWSYVPQCSPGVWDLYLTNTDGERVEFDADDCESTAQHMKAAIDAARAQGGEG